MSKAKKTSTTKSKIKIEENTDTTWSKSPMMEEKLSFFRINKQAKIPTFSTKDSACFDLSATLVEGDEIKYYGSLQNKLLPRRVSFDINSNRYFVQLNNMERMLIPTGLIADIPVGFSIRLHSRSGLAFKK